MDAMITRMRGVKRKLTSLAEEEEKLHMQTAARIAHLDELYALRSVDDVKYEAWSRRRLDRLLADYLLRHGFNDTASALATDKGMQDLVDVDTFVKMSRIRDAICRGSVAEALAWCTDNKKELRKMEASDHSPRYKCTAAKHLQSKLEFMLRFQQYIELVKGQSQDKVVEAINHAKKYLMPYANTYPREVMQAAGLLAYPPGGKGTAYEDLYKPARWAMLADLFTDAHNSLLALPSVPLLHVALSSGLSALKTPACHSIAAEQGEAPSTLANGVCPICSTELNELARNVPYAHHTKSHVEHDLVLLPNGRVYGAERLEGQARKAGLPGGSVKEPQTGLVFPTAKLKKVYIT